MKTLFCIIALTGMALAQSRAPSSCPIVAQRAAVNATGNGDNTLIAAQAKKIVVWQWFFVNTHATQDENLTLKEGSTAISGAYLLKAAGGSHTAPCTGTPWAIMPIGSAFVLNESAAGSIQGTVYFTLEN